MLADFSVHTLHLLSLPVTFSLEGKGAVRGERELNFKFTRMHEHFFFPIEDGFLHFEKQSLVCSYL